MCLKAHHFPALNVCKSNFSVWAFGQNTMDMLETSLLLKLDQH